MHLLGSRNADAPEEELLAAKRAAPPRDDEDSGDEAEAERQVLRPGALPASLQVPVACPAPRKLWNASDDCVLCLVSICENCTVICLDDLLRF